MIKTINVCLNGETTPEPLLTFAAGLASQHDAHLVGVYAVHGVEVYPTMSMYMTVEAADSMLQAQKQEAARLKLLFEESVQRESIAYDWHQDETLQMSAGLHLAALCRCCDLVVIGQPGTEAAPGNSLSQARDIIEGCGRPVLVLPRHGEFSTVGKRVMIAWSGTSESARAAYSALPLYRKSTDTEIFWVGGDVEQNQNLDQSARDLARSLSRHDINASVKHWQKSDLPIGDELLNAAADSGTDLIVSGAFGHSRLHDLMFGAVTSHLLKHMTAPVLFMN